MIKLVLSIRSLDIGGTERQFIELVRHIDKTKFDVSVCTMYGGIQEDIIKNIPDIKYYNLQKTGRYDFYLFFKSYSSLLDKINPDVIYSFLGEMNLFSLWCKPKTTKIIWGFRASNVDFKQYGKVSEAMFWLQKKLSFRVNKIISNSTASVLFHQKNGFDMSRAKVIANGIDTDKFHRDTEYRRNFRDKYCLKDNDIAVGIVARIDYMKGYIVFSEVAKKILEKYKNLYFFAIGDGDENIKRECEAILGEYNKIKFIWLGNQTEVENIYSGLDISSSSSFGEGFSNSIAEAMSCECACVVTDVGDSAMIVGDIGIFVKPNDIQDLYDGIEDMIKRDFKEIGK